MSDGRAGEGGSETARATTREPHPLCPPGTECPCASALGNKLLRGLLAAMGESLHAKPMARRLVWAETLRRIQARWSR